MNAPKNESRSADLDPLDPLGQLFVNIKDDEGPAVLNPPQKRLKNSGGDGLREPWVALTQVLAHALRLESTDGVVAGSSYLERIFPDEIDVSGLAPLAREAVSEILNLWGILLRRSDSHARALPLFDEAVKLTRRDSIRQYIYYNRGFTRLQLTLRLTSGMVSRISIADSIKSLQLARKDLQRASSLDPTDDAAWAQLGLVCLLLSNSPKLRVRKRLSLCRAAVEALDQCLEQLNDEKERSIVVNNRDLAIENARDLAIKNADELGKLSWFKRTFGRSQMAPNSIPVDENAAAIAKKTNQIKDVNDFLRLLNKPLQDAEKAPPLRDPIEVAEAIVSAFRDSWPEAGLDLAFVDSMWLLNRQGKTPGNIGTLPRRALADLTAAAQAGDPTRGLTTLDDVGSKKWLSWLGHHSDWLMAPRWPEQAARHCMDGGLECTVALIEHLGKVDPELCVELIERENDDIWRIDLTLEALLSSMDADLPHRGLENRWLKMGLDAWERQSEVWLWGELRRLSRVDLEAAEAHWQECRADFERETPYAELGVAAFMGRLAQVDPHRALQLATEDGSPMEIVARLSACQKGGADVRPLLNEYVECIHEHEYKPHVLFPHLLHLFLRLDDEDGVKQTLARAGAHGWQVAAAARWGIREAAMRASPKLNELLGCCLQSFDPGPVAGRDASAGGLSVGHVHYRPAWLSFTGVRAVDYLHVVAALDESAPQWCSSRPLP